ncbi:hypothetical protein GCM10011333_04840 [Sediminivirga luteola]|uniref:Uncharacterized protein n=1 Tax=Sediminivirga luteola TaxID=1774748 RepID=A0A8J2XDB4_9MICO|nr:hypothetical protein GCM10011333_04840 [Sediminivirga luteola]
MFPWPDRRGRQSHRGVAAFTVAGGTVAAAAMRSRPAPARDSQGLIPAHPQAHHMPAPARDRPGHAGAGRLRVLRARGAAGPCWDTGRPRMRPLATRESSVSDAAAGGEKYPRQDQPTESPDRMRAPGPAPDPPARAAQRPAAGAGGRAVPRAAPASSPDQWNWAVSVDSDIAKVEASGLTAVEIRSKYPVPTSR